MAEISWIDSWRRAVLGLNYGYKSSEHSVEVVRVLGDQTIVGTTFENQLRKIESFLLKCIDKLQDDRRRRQNGVSDIDEPQSGFSHYEIPESQSRVANLEVIESPFKFESQTRWGEIDESIQEVATNKVDQTLAVEEELDLLVPSESQDCENKDSVIPLLYDFSKDSTPSTPNGAELIQEPLKFMGDLHQPSKEHQNHVQSLQRSTAHQIGNLQKSIDDEVPFDQRIPGTLAKEIHHNFREQNYPMNSEFLEGNHQFPSPEFPETDVNLKVKLVCGIVLVDSMDDSKTNSVDSLSAQQVFDVMSRRRKFTLVLGDKILALFASGLTLISSAFDATMKDAIVDHSLP